MKKLFGILSLVLLVLAVAALLFGLFSTSTVESDTTTSGKLPTCAGILAGLILGSLFARTYGWWKENTDITIAMYAWDPRGKNGLKYVCGALASIEVRIVIQLVTVVGIFVFALTHWYPIACGFVCMLFGYAFVAMLIAFLNALTAPAAEDKEDPTEQPEETV